MDDAGVPPAVQALVYGNGFTSMRLFAGVDESRSEVRAALKTLLPLDYTADATSRQNMALLLAVWEACRLQLSAREKNKADSKLGVQARLVQTTEHASMKAAVETPHGSLSDAEVPSKSLLGQKLEQVEDNSPQAEDLRDVTSVEDAAAEAYSAVIDPASAVLRIKPGKTMTTPPCSPEELRMRRRRIGLAWEMVRSKHGPRSWLPERCTDAFRKLSDHVLGYKVAGFQAADGRSPSWSAVLVYEAELRKHAYRLVRDGEAADIAEALKVARKAPEIMRSYFIVPFMVGGQSALQREDATDPASWLLGQRSGDKGGGETSGKDGRVKKTIGKNRSLKVCFAYNKQKGCNRKDCPFAHICSRCGGQRPYQKCPEVQRPADKRKDE